MRNCELAPPRRSAFAALGKHQACPPLEDSRIAESFCKTLEADPTACDTRVHLGVERKIVARLRLAIMQRLPDRGRIKSLAHQNLLLLLEGLGGIERGGDAQEQRMRIRRQPAREMIGQTFEIE